MPRVKIVMSRLSVFRLRIKASLLVSLSLTFIVMGSSGLAQESGTEKVAGSQRAALPGQAIEGEVAVPPDPPDAPEPQSSAGDSSDSAARTEPRPPAPPNEPVEKNFTIERSVQYAKPAGKKLRADLYVPKGDGPFPGVLMIHGGGWSAGSKAQMVGHAQMAAERGYSVMAINYRHAPKYKFPAQIHDCKTAIRWWRARAAKYKLDVNRIAAYGYSAGGHLACMMGTCDPSLNLEGIDVPQDAPATAVQSVVAGGAPCDFRSMPPEATFLRYWLDGTRSEKPKVYQLASPQAAVTPDDPPTFFYHGGKDWLVPIHSAEKMEARLKQAGVMTRFYKCKGKGHIAAFMDRGAMQEAMEFLDATLKGKKE